MSLPPPPQDDDPIITQFKPYYGQWELTDNNIQLIGGQTILHNYCECINTTPLEVYRYLIETKGCDVNAQAQNKNTPLHYAFQNFNPNDGGDITVLMYLLTQKNVNANIKGGEGYTLLHYACEEINKLPLDVFKVLIETHGSDVNLQTSYNETPIYCALLYFDPNDGGDVNVFAYLLNQKDIDFNIKYKNDYTLLHTACIIDLPNTWHPLKRNAENDTILCQIVEVIAERYLQEVFDEEMTLPFKNGT